MVKFFTVLSSKIDTNESFLQREPDKLHRDIFHRPRASGERANSDALHDGKLCCHIQCWRSNACRETRGRREGVTRSPEETEGLLELFLPRYPDSQGFLLTLAYKIPPPPPQLRHPWLLEDYWFERIFVTVRLRLYCYLLSLVFLGVV